VGSALLQIRGVQLLPPAVPSQFPSVPFSPRQVISSPIYEAQIPKIVVQPFPVVKHPGSHALHASSVTKLMLASEQIWSLQALLSHLQFILPDVLALVVHSVSVMYSLHALAFVHYVPSVTQSLLMA